MSETKTKVAHMQVPAHLKEAMDYLSTGGLEEVIGLTSLALEAGMPKVQSDTDMIMCLCLLAGEALDARAEPRQ